MLNCDLKDALGLNAMSNALLNKMSNKTPNKMSIQLSNEKLIETVFLYPYRTRQWTGNC